MAEHCTSPEIKGLEVETNQAIYEIEFGQVQFEITGKCNMNCDHCRASDEARQDLPVEQIVKVMRFARRYSPNYKEVVLSGGEPLLHHGFPDVLRAVRENGGDSVFLTTNGSFIDKKILSFIDGLAFESFAISVSLDSLDAGDHNQFRHHPNGFEKAVEAIKLAADSSIKNLTVSMRTTLRPHMIDRVDEFADFAYRIGCHRISLSPILPSGKAAHRPDLWLDPQTNRAFLERLYATKRRYPKEFIVHTNDPLRCLIRGYSHVGEGDQVIFDGCGAAAVTFNVSADGTITPCSLLNIPIMNILDKTVEEIEKCYAESEIVKNMLDMNLKGKCGICEKKYQCGGCRARALVINGDYLDEDPACWL